MILPFGRYRGREISDPTVPDAYLIWMADRSVNVYRYGRPWENSNNTFQVPADIELTAREELQRRGYKRKGMRWEK